MSEAVSTLKQINPAAWLILAAATILFNRTLLSLLPLEHKVLLCAISATFIFVLATFEIRRIDKEEELKQEAFR